MEMENNLKLKILVFVFTLTAFVQVALSTDDIKTFKCLSCSGAGNFKYGLRCLNDTDSITSFITCNSSWPCSYREQINKRTGKVMSVLRRCEPYVPSGEECIYSNPNLDCVKFCFSEKCNNETNIWPPGNGNGDGHNGSEGTTISPLLFVYLAMAGYLCFIL